MGQDTEWMLRLTWTSFQDVLPPSPGLRTPPYCLANLLTTISSSPLLEATGSKAVGSKEGLRAFTS